MFRRTIRAIRRLADVCQQGQITRSSAALAYYLTLSLFPVIICLYALLGRNTGKLLQILDLADSLMNPETTRLIRSFLQYVSRNPSAAMLMAGAVLLLSSASAAVRVLRQGFCELRGTEPCRQGLRDWLLSLLFSLVFLAVLYFGILVMLSGQNVLAFLSRLLPRLQPARAWAWLRFPVLGALAFLSLWGLYGAFGQLGQGSQGAALGALTATAGLVPMSGVFSACIAASSRYSLVYGSLASVILLMSWLLFWARLIFLGAAVQLLYKEYRKNHIE